MLSHSVVAALPYYQYSPRRALVCRATGAYFLTPQEAHPPNSKPTEPEDCLESLVTLLGFFCLDNREHQEVLQKGSHPTILGRLCNLPFR